MLPLTIVTGWLGSGKTTLLNRILSEEHGLRIAVVQNEFGAIGIDGDLVIGAEFGLYELSNGCLCCAVNDDFLSVLEDLAAMEPNPDHVLIEASGIADPSAIVLSVLRHPDHGESFVLDGVIALADCLNLRRQLDETPDASAQIAFADLIVLNKIDLVDSDSVDEIEQLLRTINREAHVVRAVDAEVDVHRLLDIGGFDLSRIEIASQTISSGGERHSSIGSFSMAVDGEIDFTRFDEWIGELLRTEGEEIYRVKGILRVAGSNRSLVLQGVRSLYNWRYGNEWKEGEKSRIVFIGKGLDRAALEAGLQRTVVEPGRSLSES